MSWSESWCALVAVSLLTLGCGSNPTSPSGGLQGDSGATLTGRFADGALSSLGTPTSLATAGLAQRVASDGIYAVVLDTDTDMTEIARVEVVDGMFTLRGLPESFYLVFEDASGDRLSELKLFEGVKPNQEIDIVVDKVNGSWEVVDEKRNGIDHPGSAGVELEGLASTIVYEANPMNGSLYVDGQSVISRAAETSIRKGNRSLTLEDIHDGDRVHVRGVFEGDEVFAFEIKLQQEQDDGDPAQVPAECAPYVTGHKVTICHKKKNTLSVSVDALPAHLGHGDECGPCKP